MGRWVSLAAALLASSCLLVACAESSSEGKGQPTPDRGEQNVETTIYEVRGQIASLPAEGDPMATLRVRHEAMPHFRRQDGTLGMDTMTMPFAPAQDLDLSPFSVGDKVLLTFEVDSDVETGRFVGFRASELERLDPETELDWTPLPRDTPDGRAGGDEPTP